GPLEGTSGNPGYSSKVQGVVNCWGAIWDWKWIGKGDVPVYNVHGTADSTVPYDSSYDYHGFKYGGKIVYEAALKQGVITGWRPFYNTGHTLDNSTVKQDSAFLDINAWLFNIINLQPTGLKEKDGSLPLRNDLGQNFPNPFNSSTVIRYTLYQPGKVTLDIYDIPGQKIATVFQGFQEAGGHQCSFDASGLPSGTYFYSLITSGSTQSKKMILMK
ncbi:MAG: T9SS type A sorting domain-containing protein, partial [Syntrophothermus sp.]